MKRPALHRHLPNVCADDVRAGDVWISSCAVAHDRGARTASAADRPERYPSSTISMNPPKSIFTGTSAALSESSNPEVRRLSTPEYRETLAQAAEAPKPSTPLERPPIARPAAPPTAPPSKRPQWTLKLPSEQSDRHRQQQQSSAASRGPGGFRIAEAVRTPPPVAGKKRAARSDDTPAEPASEPLHKRRRLPTRSRHTLDHFSFAKSVGLRDNGQPPSPLFFSNTRRARPHLPARFSSSEAAARMLSKTRGEEEAIKTVKLARGTFSGLSPPGVTSATSGRTSERSSLARTTSPDGRDPLRLLGSVGIVELLEHDLRPTFIVDIGDVSNYTPGSTRLQILFANNALRANPAMWELVAGKTSSVQMIVDDASVHASNQFKGWLLSTVLQGESLDINPSPVEHGGIIWSCYTLRKRLRVVSGVNASQVATSIPSTSASNEFAIPSSSSAQLTSNGVEQSSSSSHQPDAQDYFGTSVPTLTEDSAPSEAIPAPTLSENASDLLEVKPTDSIEKSPNPDQLDLAVLDGHPSFTNECVLRAHTAGDVDAFHRDPNPSQEHDVGFFDWTRLSLSSSLPRHIQFARAVDWASTPLGPIEYWSNDLRAMCNLIM